MSGIDERYCITRRRRPLGRKRARDPLIDTEKKISNTDFRDQLSDTKDIQRVFEIAPPSKRAMYHASFDNSVGRYLAYPGRKISSENLSQVFYSSLSLKTEIPPEPQLDAAGSLLPLDPQLNVTNSVRMYLMDDPEYSSSSAAKKKAETFDKLVQSLYKSRYKALRRRNKTEIPIVTINSENVAHSSLDLELVTNEEDLQNVIDVYSTSVLKTDVSELVQPSSSESVNPNDPNATPFVNLYMIDGNYEEVPISSQDETVFEIVNSVEEEKLGPGDAYYVVSPELYDDVEYAEDIGGESQEFHAADVEPEVGEIATVSSETLLGNGNHEAEHEDPEDEEVLEILEEVELSDQVVNLVDYGYTEETSQQHSPDVELVAAVNVEDIASEDVLELGVEHDSDISQPQFYYSARSCSANVAVGGGGSNETVSEIYTNSTDAQPMSFLIFLE